MKRMSLVALLVTSLAAAAGPSYALGEPQPITPFVPGSDDDPALAAAWQRWQTKDIDDYVVTVRRSCFCRPQKAVRTVVRDDRTVRVTKGGKPLGPSLGWSMDELFTTIRAAQGEADSVRVDYTRRGVPSAIGIDWDKMVADEETYYSVRLSRL